MAGIASQWDARLAAIKQMAEQGHDPNEETPS
jgi:hypothetical protein